MASRQAIWRSETVGKWIVAGGLKQSFWLPGPLVDGRGGYRWVGFQPKMLLWSGCSGDGIAEIRWVSLL